MDIEEGNILYVAVTRAKKSLILSRALAKLLKDAGVSKTWIYRELWLDWTTWRDHWIDLFTQILSVEHPQSNLTHA